ncbi:TetR family transcriptional regulator [Nocardioides houyundeii]|uniref:TetR family transcriptional regulator n=1 Tax=Nocardioides houyundeii TaxID=2045452 RepID=UPI000C7716D3|nr:TetR family transcriptional regulator [Nocardioides houyundeii]
MASNKGEVAASLDVAALPPGQLARRRRIIGVATRLLEDTDYEQVQMRVVAESADVALGTLYRYFASKEQLYAAVLLEWSTSYEIDDSVPEDTPADRVRRRLQRALTAFERRPQFYKVQAMLQTTTDSRAELLFNEFSARNHDTLVRDLRPLARPDADDRVLLLNAALGAVLTSYAYGRMTMQEARRVMDRAVDLVVGAGGE